MGVGTRIKEILKEKNETIKWLSNKSGISQNTLYSITKRDSKRIDITTLEAIAIALEVPIKDLVQDEAGSIVSRSMPGIDTDSLLEFSESKLKVWKRAGFTPKNPPKTNNDSILIYKAAKEIEEEEQREEFIELYDNFNKAGKDVAFAQVKLVSRIPEYTDKKIPEND